jgi:glycosyltransferase involved in cell wall biosynthesis
MTELKQPLRLGIAITTFNRCEMVLDLVRTIRELTTGLYDLVICDDGSSDKTVELLRASGEKVIAGSNRGIAWNKNRGTFYLLNVARCDVVIHLDDDIIPNIDGWQDYWIKSAWEYGHVNNSPPEFRSSILSGSETPEDPGLATTISGWAFAYSRVALTAIGFMDLRFGRYGHEHSDLSFRAVRAGFGGITFPTDTGDMTCFYVIAGGLIGRPATSCGTQAELDANAKLLAASGSEPIYRHAWRTDDEMKIFLKEINQISQSQYHLNLCPSNIFSCEEYLSFNPDVKNAGFEAVSHYLQYGRNENRNGSCVETVYKPYDSDITTKYEKYDDDFQLFSRFRSLGLNCEFGVVQKISNVTKHGLLDWFTTDPVCLLRMLNERFDGVGSIEQTHVFASGKEYIVSDKKYGFSGHTFVNPEDINEDKFLIEITSRLNYLKRGMIESLEDGDEIFVYKMNHLPVDQNIIREIARSISFYGPGILLSVSDSSATGMPDGYVVRSTSNLLEGHLANMSPLGHAYDVHIPGWRNICKKALALLESPFVDERALDHIDPLKAAAEELGLPWPLPPIGMDDFDWTNFEHPLKKKFA